MDGRHPDGEYSRGAKWFHWLTLPPLALILLSGLTIRFAGDEAKMAFYTVHESLGLLMLALSAARLSWRLTYQPPPMAPAIPALEQSAANAVHTLLYTVLIVQPLLGFFTTNAYGFPQRDATAFLGFVNFPKFMEAAPGLAGSLQWAHSIVGWTLVPLIAAHVAGVVFRHAVKRDGTLLRML